jgi:hypothetical protein
MIEIFGGITIGQGIIIGDVPIDIQIVYFVTEDDNSLISEAGQYFIEE